MFSVWFPEAVAWNAIASPGSNIPRTACPFVCKRATFGAPAPNCLVSTPASTAKRAWFRQHVPCTGEHWDALSRPDSLSYWYETQSVPSATDELVREHRSYYRLPD